MSGEIRALGPDGAIVSVGGIGLQVLCSPSTLAGLRVGTHATLATALVVREDSLTLYGFVDADARSVFEVLQTATGVGPRLAQAVLGVHSPDGVRRAIAEDDLAAMCAVPGVGRKLAQRLVLELKDRIGGPEGPPSPASPGEAPARADARSALAALGYSSREAEAALATAGTSVIAGADSAELLRAALSVLRRA